MATIIKVVVIVREDQGMCAKPDGTKKKPGLTFISREWQGQKDSNPQQELEESDRYEVY